MHCCLCSELKHLPDDDSDLNLENYVECLSDACSKIAEGKPLSPSFHTRLTVLMDVLSSSLSEPSAPQSAGHDSTPPAAHRQPAHEFRDLDFREKQQTGSRLPHPGTVEPGPAEQPEVHELAQTDADVFSRQLVELFVANGLDQQSASNLILTAQSMCKTVQPSSDPNETVPDPVLLADSKQNVSSGDVADLDIDFDSRSSGMPEPELGPSIAASRRQPPPPAIAQDILAKKIQDEIQLCEVLVRIQGELVSVSELLPDEDAENQADDATSARRGEKNAHVDIRLPDNLSLSFMSKVAIGFPNISQSPAPSEKSTPSTVAAPLMASSSSSGRVPATPASAASSSAAYSPSQPYSPTQCSDIGSPSVAVSVRSSKSTTDKAKPIQTAGSSKKEHDKGKVFEVYLNC